MRAVPIPGKTPSPARRSLLAIVLAGFALGASANDAVAPAAGETAAVAPAGTQEGERLEKDLQSLSWEQFKAVVTAIPKLKADVDAYGPLGWQYVQTNYRTYPWRKNIRKLQEPQRKRLAELIDEARSGAGPQN